jgi:class 3 adenylate cyclase
VPEERILLCVGIGWGRILRIGDKDCYGAEVNAASKLGEDTAGADEVLVTGAVREAVGEIPGLAFEELQASIPGTDKAYRVRYEKLP